MLTLRWLNPNPRRVPSAVVEDVQRLFEGSPAYFRAIQGRPADAGEAHRAFFALPERFMLEQRRCYGFDLNGALVGFSEVLLGHPSPTHAYIGLHLIDERLKKKGYGARAYALLEAHLRETHPFPTRIRLAVALANPVEGFWTKMGFSRLPGLKDTLEGEIQGQVFEMEKGI